MPDESEERYRAQRKANGVPLAPDTWQSIVQSARSLEVAEASIEAI